jgi:hypothetical protein
VPALQLREREVEHLLTTRHRSAVFHRRLDFMRAQHQQVLDHTQERHKKEARELLEAQEVESRHLRMSQELQARQLPKEVQGTFLQICEVASRQLRESQNTRARQLVELQVLEMAHSTANFERGLKMAEDRHTLEASHSQVRVAVTVRGLRCVSLACSQRSVAAVAFPACAPCAWYRVPGRALSRACLPRACCRPRKCVPHVTSGSVSVLPRPT